MLFRRTLVLSSIAAALLLMAGTSAALAAPAASRAADAFGLFGGSKNVTFIRPLQKEIPTAGVTQVVLENLVGPISVQTEPGDTMHLTVLIHAGGADLTFAKLLAQQLTFKVEKIGYQERIVGEYPLNRFRDYGYPYMKSIMGIHGTDKNVYQGKKVFIRDVGSKKSIELWAEIRLTLPTSMDLVIRNIYGNVRLQGGVTPLSAGALDAFTDVGDFTLYRPNWAQIKLQSNYGKAEFTDGLGSAKDIHVSTDVGGAYLDLPPDQNGKIVAHKDLGFLHNDVSNGKFSKNAQGESVLQLGNGNGPVVHIDMSIGSLHLKKIGAD